MGYGDFTTRYLYDADIPANPTGNPYGLLDGIVTNQTNPEGGAIQVTTDITTDRWAQLVRNSSHENEVDVGSNWMGDVKTLDMAVGSQQVDTTIYRDRWGNAAVILRSNQDSSGGEPDLHGGTGETEGPYRRGRSFSPEGGTGRRRRRPCRSAARPQPVGRHRPCRPGTRGRDSRGDGGSTGPGHPPALRQTSQGLTPPTALRDAATTDPQAPPAS